MQSAGQAWNASQKDRASGANEHARVQRWVHIDLKREWMCVTDDELQILPWQTPKNGVACSCSHVLLLLSTVNWLWPGEDAERPIKKKTQNASPLDIHCVHQRRTCKGFITVKTLPFHSNSPTCRHCVDGHSQRALEAHQNPETTRATKKENQGQENK